MPYGSKGLGFGGLGCRGSKYKVSTYVHWALKSVNVTSGIVYNRHQNSGMVFFAEGSCRIQVEGLEIMQALWFRLQELLPLRESLLPTWASLSRRTSETGPLNFPRDVSMEHTEIKGVLRDVLDKLPRLVSADAPRTSLARQDLLRNR